MAKRDRQVLHDRADPDGELLLASVAAPEVAGVPRPALGLHLYHVGVPAAGAGRGVTPPLAFHELDGRPLIGAGAWQLGHDFGLILADWILRLPLFLG